MTTHEPRVLGDVDARLLGNSVEQIETVREWVRSLPPEYTVTVPTQKNAWNVVVTKDDFALSASNGYIFWDGTTLRTASKEAFELVYAPAV
jgi:hypothetical protein